MLGKDRDTEAIQQFCNSYKEYCENVRNAATQLKMVAQAAESGLRDEVGRKAIDNVYEFCDRLVAVVYQGEQPILELEKEISRCRMKWRKFAGDCDENYRYGRRCGQTP